MFNIKLALGEVILGHKAGSQSLCLLCLCRLCGQPYSVNHCLTCKLGGYVILRHNSIRDLFAELLSEVCKDVIT